MLGFSSEEGTLEGHSEKDNYFPVRNSQWRLFGANIVIVEQRSSHVLELKNTGIEYQSRFLSGSVETQLLSHFQPMK